MSIYWHKLIQRLGVKLFLQWLSLKAIMLIRFNKDFHSIMKTIDMNRFKVLQEKYDLPHRKGSGIKYLNISEYIPVHLKRAYSLNLHNAKPLNILDIGTGPGYFPHICNHFGHKTMSIDLGDIPVYNDAISFLKIDRKVWTVKAFEKLPDFGKKFDLITAFRVVFNNHSRPSDVWGVDEWEFFLKDLTHNLLTENGRVFLDLNAEKARAHLLLHGRFDDALLKFFIEHGAEINYSQVYFKSMEKFRDRLPEKSHWVEVA